MIGYYYDERISETLHHPEKNKKASYTLHYNLRVESMIHEYRRIVAIISHSISVRRPQYI